MEHVAKIVGCTRTAKRHASAKAPSERLNPEVMLYSQMKEMICSPRRLRHTLGFLTKYLKQAKKLPGMYVNVQMCKYKTRKIGLC